jgi:hypothetical protein
MAPKERIAIACRRCRPRQLGDHAPDDECLALDAWPAPYSWDNRKLLGFTDNRQDAPLQAGHFNDFTFVSLLRGAIYRALMQPGEAGLGDSDLGAAVRAALGFNQPLGSTDAPEESHRAE